jgi:Tfp pilus assembly protein PilX
MNFARHRRGGALVAALVTLLAVTLVAGAVIRLVLHSQRQAWQHQHELQAQWLAESAISRGIAQLNRQPGYSGETWQPDMTMNGGDKPAATVEIRIDSAGEAESTRRIIAIAQYPNHEWRRVTVRREHPLSLSPPASPAETPEANP